MKYFTEIDLPVYADLHTELNKLIEAKTIAWHFRQICINTTVNEPDNYVLGCGSLIYDWENLKEEFTTTGELKLVVPKKENIIKDSDFTILCSQFKNTIFEEVYNTVKEKFNIGRFRLMMINPKTCLSWHTDSSPRLHYPIKTQEGCMMIIEDEVFHLNQNTWYMADTTFKHTALNASKEARIHLVVEITA